jgi:nicotinate-nucleotide adenylyltransferase
MVRLATRVDPAVEVSTIETDRRGPSFTAETLEALVEAHPGAELFFIVGEDALSDLPYWRHPERIIALALLAVARRPGTDTADRAWRSLPGIEERIAWIEMEPVAISASEIRRRIRAGDPVQGMLPEAVERYIHDNRLYR